MRNPSGDAGYRQGQTGLARRAGQTVAFVFFCLLAFVVVYPIFFAFNSALKEQTAFKTDRLSFSVPPNFDALKSVWSIIDVPHSVTISLIVATGTLLGVWFAGSLAAYAYTKLPMKGASLLFIIVIGSLMVPVQVVLTPLFLVERSLNLLDNLLGLVLAMVAFQLPVATFMFATYFHRLPNEVIDAAAVDGASPIRTWWHVILPMSRPALATVGVISFVWSWNELLLPLIVIQSVDLQPLTVRAAQMQGNFTPEPVLEAAGVAFALVPMVIAFLVAQRQLVSAVTVGATK